MGENRGSMGDMLRSFLVGSMMAFSSLGAFLP